ncbi:hypothetical protein HN358_00420 [Candidatus Uhrbacteria bacterium]|nr:hypothetical protein [Candidatus Uhrbacteria bacterium]MBT7717694.1 hypothetical protein [Candidatus Uhrbacteria bacterium]
MIEAFTGFTVWFIVVPSVCVLVAILVAWSHWRQKLFKRISGRYDFSDNINEWWVRIDDVACRLVIVIGLTLCMTLGSQF